MQSEVSETKLFFENHQIQLSDFWLQSCIDWFHQEIGNTPYSTKELHTKVYEQWLLLDLRDVEVPQLPPNINNEKKIILNRSLSLQVMSVIDIAKPKLSQLQKIKNLNALTRGFEDEKDTASVGPVSKRMLQLTLTDGVQEIKAIEYKPILSLNINLTPGMKVKINGPVTVRRGQIMLEQQNIKLLGGEVEEILVSHAVENVLARYLNLPQNSDPNIVDESVLDGSRNENNNQSISSYDRRNDISIGTNNNANLRNVKQSLITNYSNVNRNQTSKSKTNIDISEEEELRIAAEVDMLLEVENDIGRNNPKEPTQRKVANNLLNQQYKQTIDDQSEVEAEIEMLWEAENDMLQESSAQKTARRNNAHTPDMFDNNTKNVSKLDMQSKNIDNTGTLNSSLELEDDLFSSFEMENHLSKIEKKYHTTETVTINNILDNIRNKKYGKYKSHGKFKSIIQKMTVIDNKWIVLISITDDQNELAVFIHSNIVSEMTELTPEESMGLRKLIESKDVNATNKILKALDQFKDKLLKLDCMMEIEFSDVNKSPVITKLL